MASAIKDSDSELRQRNVGSVQQNTSPGSSSLQPNPDASANEDTGAIESDGRIDEGADSDGPGGVDLSSVAKEIGQDGQSAGTQALETALGGLPPKWKNYTIRFIFTWLMI